MKARAWISSMFLCRALWVLVMSRFICVLGVWWCLEQEELKGVSSCLQSMANWCITEMEVQWTPFCLNP